MRLFGRHSMLAVLALLAVAACAQLVLESAAEARAGGGRSGGFRGSRGFTNPARPASPARPAEPRRESTAPQQPAPMAAQSGGFMRTFGMAMLGGFLGSMLFSGLAHAGLGGFGGSGFGMIEILLLAALGYFLYRKFAQPAPARQAALQYQGTPPHADDFRPGGYAPAASAPTEAPGRDRAVDFSALAMMDPNFTAERFLKIAQDLFFKIQGAWNKQDTNTLRALCGAELFKTWQEELASLAGRGRQNRMENIALRQSVITEAWTENGEDYVTVRFGANLLDYTVDARSGAVVDGSNSEAIEFEEYWTFARPVGPNDWKLTAVQQA